MKGARLPQERRAPPVDWVRGGGAFSELCVCASQKSHALYVLQTVYTKSARSRGSVEVYIRSAAKAYRASPADAGPKST